MSDIIPEGILYGNLAVGSGTTNYNDLDNKPQINSVTLQGNKTASELGLVGTADIPVTSVNGETGAVVLDGTEIEFSTGVSLNEKIIAVEQEIPVIAYPVTSVNGETGAVVLDGTEINYQAGKTINQKIDEVEAEIPVISYPVTSVNGETGAVVLDGTDIEYSSGVSVNSQIDTLMNYIPVYGNTASGAIATFDTSIALPLQDCTIAINAVQESGTPTPSSPKLISGFTGANITRCGKNLFDKTSNSIQSNARIATSAGGTYGASGYSVSPYIKVDNINSFVLTSGIASYYAGYDANKQFIAGGTWNTATAKTFSLAVYIRFDFSTENIDTVQLEIGSTATTYEAYNGTTTAISWQSEAGTVYGGSLDVTSGVLTVTWGSVDLGSLTWTKETNHFYSNAVLELVAPPANSDVANALCSIYTTISYTSLVTEQTDNTVAISKNKRVYVYDSNYANSDATTFKTAMNGVGIVVMLVTPQTYQLTPTQISAIVGTNNVFTDTNGDTSVVYACSLKDYIDGQ